YLRSINEMNRRDDYLSYRFGQSVWAYIGEKWGDEAVGVLLQKAPRTGLDRAFESTLGIPLAELSREWLASVRNTYLPQIADYQQPLFFAKQLTAHNKLNHPWFLAPAISADGKNMLVLSQRSGFYFDLWLADARTGRFRKKLISAAQDANFESLRYMNSSATFSPDGNLVAFAAQTSGQDALYIYDLRRQRITHKLKFRLNGVASPSFSPDGRRIVFSGNDGGISDLFVTDLSGKLTRLTDDKHADLLPAWSPDGRSIAFTTDRGPQTDFEALKIGNYRVALYDVDARTINILPGQERGKNHNPVWSPDSRQLIWVNDATGINNLYLYELATGQLERITDILSGAIAIVPTSPVLSWSRSGRLLFNYFEKAGYNVYAVEDPRALPRIKVEPQVAEAQSGEASNGVALDDGPVRSFYRQGSSFRPSAARPLYVGVKPLSVVALLDSAQTALPDTAQFEHADYKTRFTPDVIGRPTIGAQVGGYYGNGLYGGSFIALSDMLGNHNLLLAAEMNGSFSDAQIFAGYAFLKTRANFAAAISQMPLYRYLGTGVIDSPERPGETARANIFQRDVIRSAAVSVSYPFNTFLRFELGASGVYYSSQLLLRGQYIESRQPLNYDMDVDRLAYWEPSAAVVYDNSLYGWTGPVIGRRYRMQFSKPMGEYDFTEALIDFRNYTNYRQSIVFATRFTALSRTGRDSDRFLLYWGGPYFIRGYDADSYEFGSDECVQSQAGGETISACPVRDQLIGSSAAFVNAELRFPIIKRLHVGVLGSFPPVDLVTFFDAGLAWNNRICLEVNPLDPRGCTAGQERDVELAWRRREGQDPFLVRAPVYSYGLGLRFNVFYTVLRLDYAVPLSRPARPGFNDGVFSISFGPSF
ncbi:MAG TPA: BamA/TamA family outer membrane protein, partial [Longimicrobiales bacterium]